jgi:hypothetical protein
MIFLHAYCIIVHVNGPSITLNIIYGVSNEIIIQDLRDHKPCSLKCYFLQLVMESSIPFVKTLTHQSR